MNYFSYFLSAFPETARALSGELVDLQTDVDRATLWKEALALTRQLYGNMDGWKAHLELLFEATLKQFISTIPPNKALVFCFGLPEYLHQGLIDALIWEVFRERPSRTKLLRCAPENLILLKPNLDVENFYHPDTTEAHRRQVLRYRRMILKGRLRGPHGPFSMSDEEFRHKWPDARAELLGKELRDTHANIAAKMGLEERTYYNFWGRNRHFLEQH